MVCNNEYPENRTNFKLLASKCCFEKLEIIENKANGVGRFKTQMIIDCLLAELIGAKDALFHEINCELNLGLSNKRVTKYNNKDKKFEIEKKLEERKDFLSKRVLRRLRKLHTPKHWLNQLRKYRNFSIHQDILWHIEVSPSSLPKVSLRYLDPEHPECGEGPEIISYFKDVIDKMDNLINDFHKDFKQKII